MIHTPKLRDAARQRAIAAMQRRPIDPTPKEIAASCAAIQAQWCECEERLRRPAANRWRLEEVRTLDLCVG